ncbi:High cysteine membrane protein Group 6 [Giardia lamblia P15]|uniref:High cysteine membrane protein Group 6 n=1 Tax=Giardia intestinalis (strain P15) TaxID=658858 RepID=E1F667_GIAIA|nr:High cysteine membrane protein Group 6 [Giardia lamblia P15]
MDNDSMFGGLIFVFAALQLSWARRATKSLKEVDQCKDCEANSCELVGDAPICTRCSVGMVPIDGTCKAYNNRDVTTAGCKAGGANVGEDATVCEECGTAGAYFLYKGGCYEANRGVGASLCTQAANGYFVSPGAQKADQSVISCSEKTEITVNGRKYTGVAHCVQCQQPNANMGDTAVGPTCQACEDGFFGTTCEACDPSCKTCEGGNGADKCKSCTAETHFLGATSDTLGRCILCGDTSDAAWKGVDGCLKCTASGSANTPATCTECQEDRYFKAKIENTAESCETKESCIGTHFPNDNADGKKRCLLCSDKNGGIERCGECALLSQATRATALVKCSKCTTGNLSPLGDECMLDCPAGTYADSNVCKPCHESCSGCETGNAEASCTACYPGSVLSHDGSEPAGACIPECTGSYAANCEENMCTAVVGGSKYCSKCKVGFVPIDGLCVSTAARAATACVAGEGVCTSCAGGYFLESGGCYKAGAFPGNTLCIAAGVNGKCANCANGQSADPQTGSCPPCPANCSKCSGDSSAKTCTECYSGYYLDAGKACKKCSETSGDIQGVPNCISCKAPASLDVSTLVTCYVKTDGTSGGGGDSGSGGGSTNKSGLSTGAIVGIAVAVIVVVGGLAGFLCWWFICRGRA